MAKANFIPTGSRAAQLGGTLGSALGTGLNALIGHKLHQIKQRNFVKSGYTPEQADLLSTTQDPRMFKSLIDHFTPQAQQSPQDLQGLMEMLSSKGQLPQELQNQQGGVGITPEMLQQQQVGNFSFLQPQQQQLNQVQQLLKQLQTQQPNIPLSKPSEINKNIRQEKAITSRKEASEYKEKMSLAKESRKRMEKVLDFYNFDPDEIKFLVETPEMNQDVIDIFLKHTGNDPKKAKAMAKKVGFKV